MEDVKQKIAGFIKRSRFTIYSGYDTCTILHYDQSMRREMIQDAYPGNDEESGKAREHYFEVCDAIDRHNLDTLAKMVTNYDKNQPLGHDDTMELEIEFDGNQFGSITVEFAENSLGQIEYNAVSVEAKFGVAIDHWMTATRDVYGKIIDPPFFTVGADLAYTMTAIERT